VYWRVRDHPEASGWFLVEKFEDGWYVGEFSDSYENAGVEDSEGTAPEINRLPQRDARGALR